MSEHLTPLEVCERMIGPLERIGSICGIHPKAPYLWRRASVGRRGGDFPHATHMRALLAHASANGIPLTADHLIWGASAAEIEALLARSRGCAA